MTFSFPTPRPLTTYTPVSGRAMPINGGAGEGEQGEQTGLLAAGTCGIGARGRRVGWAARRSGWSGREAHLARRSPPSCRVGDCVEEGDVAEEGWAQA